MLERSQVVRGGEYIIDGERWWVLFIHRPGNGESVTLYDCDLAEWERRVSCSPPVYSKTKYMQMRRFQKAASLVSHD